MTEKKVTYEQSLALERGQSVMRANRRRRAAVTVAPNTDQAARWEADRRTALAAYRDRKAAK